VLFAQDVNVPDTDIFISINAWCSLRVLKLYDAVQRAKNSWILLNEIGKNSVRVTVGDTVRIVPIMHINHLLKAHNHLSLSAQVYLTTDSQHVTFSRWSVSGAESTVRNCSLVAIREACKTDIFRPIRRILKDMFSPYYSASSALDDVLHKYSK